ENGVDSSKSEVIKEENKEEAKEENKEEAKEENKEEAKEENKGEESTRKRKLGTSEKENDELKLHLTIAPDEEKEVDYEILDRKYPIKEWKTECLGTKPHVDKAKNLEEINQNVLVMDKYRDEIPGGFDKVLWEDLMLHGSLGVHTLVTEAGLVIHMLVEKKYSLRKKVLVQMLKLKLESEEDSTMALELIKDFDGDEEDL
ncbi:hypothetical protein Tco_1527385, partial [Tanacetum coccineum]